jgi:ferredoxin-NADP reductase/DMSO/TMAO reductase YedYZ heme-binding membrane subunit
VTDAWCSTDHDRKDAVTTSVSRAAPPRTAHPGRITAPPALTVIAAGALLVLALWWKDTAYVSGLGGWLTNAGRITGLECGYGVVVLLALMARVPALEVGVGTDVLARWHAMGGRYVVSLAAAHTLLITWGYSVTANRSFFGEIADVNTKYADVLMATVAVGLLLLVGVTSARAARRKLAYETWHFIHLYTYLAIALSFSHQFATGADFVDVKARVLWSTLYIGVALVLIRYRIVEPIASSVRHRFRVVAVHPESADAFSIYISGRDLTRLRAQPGQFFRWRFLTRDLWWVGNPYSLSAPPRPDLLRITVRIAGEHSAQLSRLKPGTRVFAEGPYGGLTAARRTRRQVLLIAGGVGITPLRSLFETIPGGPGDVALIYRASRPVDVLLRSELDDIAARRGARLDYIIGPRAQGSKDPLSAANLRKRVGDLRDCDVYLCGPDAMTEAVRTSLRQLKVPANRIHHESFTF